MASDAKFDPRVMRLFDGYVSQMYGGLDERVNATWPDFKKVLQAADASYVNFEYTGANHGFHNYTTPRYDDDAAKLSWKRTTGFFAEHLGD